MFNNRLKSTLRLQKFFFPMLIYCQYPALLLQAAKEIFTQKNPIIRVWDDLAKFLTTY
jgi:hypothetical protein